MLHVLTRRLPRALDRLPGHYVPLACYLLVCAVMVLLCAQATAGVYTYPLDDAYIGMAMAKNFSQHGV